LYRRRFRSGRAIILARESLACSGNGYESTEYKAKRGLFDLTPPIA